MSEQVFKILPLNPDNPGVSPAPDFLVFPATRDPGDVPGEVLKDLESRMPAKHQFRDPNVVTWAHETTHGVHSRLRNEHVGDENMIYVLGGYAIAVEEPRLSLTAVAERIPAKLRGDLYKTYLVDAARSAIRSSPVTDKWGLAVSNWNDRPLYVWDEWNSYVNGSLCQQELKVRERADSLASMLEMMVYGIYVVIADGAKTDTPARQQRMNALLWLVRRTLKIWEDSDRTGVSYRYVAKLESSGYEVMEFLATHGIDLATSLMLPQFVIRKKVSDGWCEPGVGEEDKYLSYELALKTLAKKTRHGQLAGESSDYVLELADGSPEDSPRRQYFRALECQRLDPGIMPLLAAMTYTKQLYGLALLELQASLGRLIGDEAAEKLAGVFEGGTSVEEGQEIYPEDIYSKYVQVILPWLHGLTVQLGVEENTAPIPEPIADAAEWFQRGSSVIVLARPHEAVAAHRAILELNSFWAGPCKLRSLWFIDQNEPYNLELGLASQVAASMWQQAATKNRDWEKVVQTLARGQAAAPSVVLVSRLDLAGTIYGGAVSTDAHKRLRQLAKSYSAVMVSSVVAEADDFARVEKTFKPYATVLRLGVSMDGDTTTLSLGDKQLCTVPTTEISRIIA